MKILVLRFSSMGDILLASPVLDTLKSKFPGCEIDWIVHKKFEEVLRTNPLIDKLIVFSNSESLKKIKKSSDLKNYDLIFDLHKNSKTKYLIRGLKNVYSYKKREFDRFMLVHFKKRYKQIIPVTRLYFRALEDAGIETPGSWKLRFGLLKDSEVKTVNQYDLHNFNYIVMAPGASYATKMWPKEYFRDLAKKLTSQDYRNRKVVIIGKGPVETDNACYIKSGMEEKIIDLTDKLDLQKTATVIKFADLVITNDNGPMHLAECFGKKIVAVFGCTTEEFGFFPYSTKYEVVEDEFLSCRPCTHFGRKKCPRRHFKCMNNLKPEKVIESVNRMLDDR